MNINIIHHQCHSVMIDLDFFLDYHFSERCEMYDREESSEIA